MNHITIVNITKIRRRYAQGNNVLSDNNGTFSAFDLCGGIV